MYKTFKVRFIVMKFGMSCTLCILKAKAVMKKGTIKTSVAVLALQFRNVTGPLSQYDHEVFRLFICDFTCKTIIVLTFLLIRLTYFCLISNIFPTSQVSLFRANNVHLSMISPTIILVTQYFQLIIEMIHYIHTSDEITLR